MQQLDIHFSGAPVSKKEYSPTSVVEANQGMEAGRRAQPGPLPEESTGSAGSASAASPERHPATEDSGEEEASVAAPSPSPPSPRASDGGTAPAEQDLAQLRVLGRQLLQGWAEALGALAKLPGVGSMRVETLAARLASLARDASPAAAAAAAAQQAADAGGGAGASATDGGAASGLPAVTSRGGTPPLAAPPAGPPPSELAGPNSKQPQAYSDPVDMFATAAKSTHLPYPELLHAFAASAEGLDDEALADYLFNLAMLCAEPPENELVVRPVLSLPQNSEEQQQYRRRQAVSSSAPVDAMLAAMQQQQAQQQQAATAAAAGGSGTRSPGGGGGLTHEAIWQQILAQQAAQQILAQQAAQQAQAQQQQLGRLTATRSAAAHLQTSPARSKSDMLSSFQAALGDVQLQGLLRGSSATTQQFAAAAAPQLQTSYQAAAAALTAAAGSPMSPTRGLAGGGSPLAKAVSAPERDLWLTAASLASEAEAKQQEAAAAAAAAAAASASFSFHPQPPSPTFGRMAGPGLASASGSAAGSGLWSNSGGGAGGSSSGASLNRSAGGSGQYRSLSDFSY
ncbi:hypothetical protein ABPG75_000295 [Micractinium tetrahymenae]